MSSARKMHQTRVGVAMAVLETAFPGLPSFEGYQSRTRGARSREESKAGSIQIISHHTSPTPKQPALFFHLPHNCPPPITEANVFATHRQAPLKRQDSQPCYPLLPNFCCHLLPESLTISVAATTTSVLRHFTTSFRPLE